jgi:hypothetical protein
LTAGDGGLSGGAETDAGEHSNIIERLLAFGLVRKKQ